MPAANIVPAPVRRFLVGRAGDTFRISVKPGAYNWFEVKLTRDEATELMLSLMRLLLQRDKSKS